MQRSGCASANTVRDEEFRLDELSIEMPRIGRGRVNFWQPEWSDPDGDERLEEETHGTTLPLVFFRVEGRDAPSFRGPRAALECVLVERPRW